MAATVTDSIVLQSRHSAHAPFTVTCLKDLNYSTIYSKHALYLHLHCDWPSCLSYRCSSPVYLLRVMRRDLVCHTDETRIRREAQIRNNDVADYFKLDENQKRDNDELDNEPDYFYYDDNEKRGEGGGETDECWP